MQFSQNYVANEASFKAQKVMLPLLKCHFFCFWSKFVFFTHHLDNKYNFPKSGFATVWYTWQNIPMQKII